MVRRKGPRGISPGSLQTTEIPFLRPGGKRRISKEDALCIQSFRSVALLTLLLPRCLTITSCVSFLDASNAPEMRVDVREKEDAFLLEADLPGVKKEDISLDVNDGVLTDQC